MFHSNVEKKFIERRRTLIISSAKSKKKNERKDDDDDQGNDQSNDEKQSPPIQSQDKNVKENNILSLLSNPYKAGKELRKTINTALESLGPGLSPEQKSIYYLDDRFLESSPTPSKGALDFAQRNTLFDRIGSSIDDDYIPEVLVIGATGSIGRLVVRRLILSGRFRVRVLVRDLYSQTLNMLGTGVTYCQGDLNNIESLEYALTDVDKIVFCAGPPRRDEPEFDSKFRDFVKENLGKEHDDDLNGSDQEDLDFQKISDTLQLRSILAEQIDAIGMQNVVQAYQNVRHADYGTSQAAKRSLFKFQDREEDFNLFTINNESPSYEEKENGIPNTSIITQVKWMQNQFKSGVFVGKIPVALNGKGSETSIISSRLRSRDEPEQGTDLSNGFAGFVCRTCGDGKIYECFVRTSEYESEGIEYICKFETERKPTRDDNKSTNKFITVRLPFSNFVPVLRRGKSDSEAIESSMQGRQFTGKDLKQIGFRFNSADNHSYDKRWKWIKFYLAISYIKVYRSQPEPEFIYLSDARIPFELKNGMVRHDIRRIKVTPNDEGTLFDEDEVKRIMQNRKDRSGEELYFKYKGEEILKKSGLSYSIIRIPELNELQSAEFSTIQLKQTNHDLSTVSRSEVAAVCVSALLDPNARNVSFYLSKSKSGARNIDIDENISNQFIDLKPET